MRIYFALYIIMHFLPGLETARARYGGNPGRVIPSLYPVSNLPFSYSFFTGPISITNTARSIELTVVKV